ncbi:MAG: hypothetical protein FWC50_07025 [Planctomycetaceae bacterium]|nr:hypothetical protein [Planctomycetaceae bacterium]
MKKSSIFTLVVALFVTGGTLMAVSPVFRAVVWKKIDEVSSWSADAIQADPLGYIKFVEKKLTGDQNRIQENWRNLGVSVGKLAKKQSDKRGLLSRGTEFAEEFREAYHNAEGKFPLEVHGQSYTEIQLRSQLSLLLAQNDGLTLSLSEMDTVMNNANSKMEELTVQKEKTESQLALLDTKRELFKAEKLSLEGLQLIANVNELFRENEQVIAGNPVRTIEQIIQAEKLAAAPANSARVEEFLNAKKNDKPNVVKIEASQKIEVSQMNDQEEAKKEMLPSVFSKKVNKKQRINEKQSQVIYQQSI